jgi:hypothetical protein
MHRIALHVLERVVHPAHVPLVVEAESAFSTGRDTPPHAVDSSAIVTACGSSRAIRLFVSRMKAIASRFSRRRGCSDPFAGRTAVVEIQHRGDRIDAQAVDAVALDPEQRVRGEEVADLVPAVVVDQRLPVVMEALPRIGVLVERRAVEIGEPVRVVGKMPGTQSSRHADPRFVQPFDERGEFFRRPVPRGSARRGRAADSPMSRRTDAPSPAAARRG